MIDQEIQKRIDTWLNGPYDDETKAVIKKLLVENEKELIDAFYTNLSFGTGGLRGLMGVGTNRMNQYTVKAATQGLANYIKKQPHSNQKSSVFISYDSRHNSKLFAEEASKVLAGNGLHVYLTEEIRPTPYVSFGCRFKQCQAAIMITASHNPKEYNGYKVYWNDGAQVLPPHDVGIIDEVNLITSLDQIRQVSINDPHIEHVLNHVDEVYLNEINKLPLFQKQNLEKGNQLSIVYTSLHGTGITLIPKAFEHSGFKNVSYVEKQCIPDADFPTLKSPNPEEKAALQLGIDLLEKINGDILIATDPDADRVGVAVKHKNDVIILNGNQIACMLLDHIIKGLNANGHMPRNATFIKTIVTTELFKEIVKSSQKECVDVLTGFKYIAEKIREWETVENGPKYIFGAEESYGYLFGTIVRDKDAISTSLILAEMALSLKLEGKTLVDKLNDIYKTHGLFVEGLLSVKFEETKDGKEKMQKGMDKLEKNPPKSINGSAVILLENYAKSISMDMKSGKESVITLPKSDVLIFWLEDGSKLIVRPSGTEPKIKIYGGVVNKKFDNMEVALREAKEKVNSALASLEKELR